MATSLTPQEEQYQRAHIHDDRRGELVGPTSRDGYVSTLVCTAGMQSLASGDPVAVEVPSS